MSTPRVTIVTLYHNRRDHVHASIQSLLDQDYDNYKVIALDDGSTDDTYEVLKSIKHPKLEVRTHANRGFTASITELMGGLSSEFLAVHGSGDISHPSRLRRQVEALDSDPSAVMCVTANRTVDASTGRTIGVRNFKSPRLDRRDIAATTPFTHGTVMYRRWAYEGAGGYEPSIKFCSDWDLWFRMLSLGHCQYINDVLYDRLAQEDGASFHPKKSVEQVKCKHLSLKLSRLSLEERNRTLEVLRSSGLDAATESERFVVARDIARREVKLNLMGRRAEAAELHRLAISAGVRYKPLHILWGIGSSGLSRSGLSPDFLIRSARRLIRR